MVRMFCWLSVHCFGEEFGQDAHFGMNYSGSVWVVVVFTCIAIMYLFCDIAGLAKSIVFLPCGIVYTILTSLVHIDGLGFYLCK